MTEREIITGMDAFALELLKQAREQTEGLADRLATFKEIGRWVSIKHGLEDSDGNEGHTLHDLKSRLKGDDAEPAHHRSGVGRNGRHPKVLDPDEPGAGSGLDKLRAKLPVIGNRTNNRSFRRIGRDSGGAPFAPAGGGGSVPADLSGGAKPKPDGDGGSDELRRDNFSSADLALRKEGLS